MSRFAVGLAAIAFVVIGVYFAFTKSNPFADPFELQAVFEDAQNVKAGSPVRVAGVEVGTVNGVEALEDGSGRALVTMEIDDAGLPIHEDAELQIRPRLFLEGNFLVNLKPGSPSEGIVDDGDRIPVSQTANSVSFEQILKVLDKDTRASFGTLLDEFARGLEKGGAKGFNRSIKYWKPAYRYSAIASEAFLGEEPGDLRRLIRGQGQLSRALTQDPEALKGVITNLNVTTRAFAREDDALEATIPALRDVIDEGMPALASLNASFPQLRGFARDALPGVRSTPRTVEVSLPFIRQLRKLMSEDELRALAADLRETIPPLAKLNARTIPFLRQGRALSSCTTDVLVPAAREPLPDPDFPDANGEPLYQDGPRAFVGLAGESRIGDANGQTFRVLAGGGPNTLVEPTGPTGEPLLFQTLFPALGARPAPPREKPPFRPGVPCETQEPPDMEAAYAPPSGTRARSTRTLPRDPERRREFRRSFENLARGLDAELPDEPAKPTPKDKEGSR